MKIRKILLVCLTGFVVLFVVLTKSNIVNVNKSSMQTSLSSSWNTSKSIGKIKGSTNELSLTSVPVVVTYRQKSIGDINSDNPVKIDISDKDFGFSWFPFVKTFDYSFAVALNEKREFKMNSLTGALNINGNINVSGRCKFIGTTSSKMAKSSVVDKVLEDIYNDAKRNLNKGDR